MQIVQQYRIHRITSNQSHQNIFVLQIVDDNPLMNDSKSILKLFDEDCQHFGISTSSEGRCLECTLEPYLPPESYLNDVFTEINQTIDRATIAEITKQKVWSPKHAENNASFRTSYYLHLVSDSNYDLRVKLTRNQYYECVRFDYQYEFTVSFVLLPLDPAERERQALMTGWALLPRLAAK